MSHESGKTLKVLTRLIIGVLGLTGMVSGFRQIGRGLDEIRGGTENAKLITAGDAQVDSANVAMAASRELLVTLMNDFDKLGLIAARQQDSTEAREAHELYMQASSHFRIAAKLAGEYSAKDDRAPAKSIWALKVASYNGYADFEAINQQIVDLFRDVSETNPKAVTERLLSLAQTRDSLQAAAVSAGTQAEAAIAALKK